MSASSPSKASATNSSPDPCRPSTPASVSTLSLPQPPATSHPIRQHLYHSPTLRIRLRPFSSAPCTSHPHPPPSLPHSAIPPPPPSLPPTQPPFPSVSAALPAASTASLHPHHVTALPYHSLHPPHRLLRYVYSLPPSLSSPLTALSLLPPLPPPPSVSSPPASEPTARLPLSRMHPFATRPATDSDRLPDAIPQPSAGGLDLPFPSAIRPTATTKNTVS